MTTQNDLNVVFFYVCIFRDVACSLVSLGTPSSPKNFEFFGSKLLKGGEGGVLTLLATFLACMYNQPDYYSLSLNHCGI